MNFVYFLFWTNWAVKAVILLKYPIIEGGFFDIFIGKNKYKIRASVHSVKILTNKLIKIKVRIW